ncbi:GntR family transcriptional regulator [Demequina iriomotensis]|uniref:GntR family transcriptional regulator n=1 Tax=Demequina iriomotensis TaxID=1536641 RepID=UPI000783C1D9|nr:GntR family transcriptional regulator [Demequina iriomotensis]
MRIAIDTSRATPPFEQIRDQIAALIRAGGLADGTRLPPIRQLAADLSLAPGTVARAYAELEAAGLVATGRARGTRVIGQGAPDPRLVVAADAFIDLAASRGLDAAAMAALITTRASARGTSPSDSP